MQPDAELLDLLSVHLYRGSSLSAWRAMGAPSEVPVVDEDVGDHRPRVALERPQVVGEREAHGLARLGHGVSRIHHRSREARERLANPGAEQGGDGAGEEAAGTQDYHVSPLYGGDHTRRRRRARRFHLDPRNGLAHLAHDRLATA